MHDTIPDDDWRTALFIFLLILTWWAWVPAAMIATDDFWRD